MKKDYLKQLIMGSIVKDISIIPHATEENVFGVRVIIECMKCGHNWNIDNFDDTECGIFMEKLKNNTPTVETVCTNCNHIINLN